MNFKTQFLVIGIQSLAAYLDIWELEVIFWWGFHVPHDNLTGVHVVITVISKLLQRYT